MKAKSPTTYSHKEIEQKWIKIWENSHLYETPKGVRKENKYYILPQLPYPSGEGLHVGHAEVYTSCDIYARFQRMKGKKVLQVIGWDAFGLPAENFAIKNNVHPRINTDKAIHNFRKQIKSLGISVDWSREVGSHNPDYYKFTQWFFLLMYNQGLAYRNKQIVNWCDGCKTVLANEQVVEGKCERCRTVIVQKEMEQWYLKITDYADRLSKDLDKIDWPKESIKRQRDWIGKKEGINITYQVEGTDETITCFTTRPDTNFGATFIVLAPEHTFVNKITNYKLKITNNQKTKETKRQEIITYVEQTKKKTELERISEGRKKTGVFTGFYAVNQLNNKKLPIWISDFVIASFGTGALVGVPGHDKRDFEFAHEFKLPIIRVVKGKDNDTSEISSIEQVQEEEGVMVNSEFLNGLNIIKAIEKMMDYLEKKGWGKRVVIYKLRDWSVSRQRFWGAPIPMVYDSKGNLHPVKEDDLPVLLPDNVDFVPTGQSPLTYSKDFQKGVEEKYGKGWKREVDTLDTFMCSSWYYYRYLDPHNDKEFASKEALREWMPVDFYIGGTEHVTGHLLYSRFFTKVLYDAGYIDFDEPFLFHRHQGTIYGPDGRRMSKRWGNIINPTDVVEMYGADTARVYEMFMGPLEQDKAWNDFAAKGVRRFIVRFWNLMIDEKKSNAKNSSSSLEKLLHKTIKIVGSDIQSLKYNTAIARLMEFINAWSKEKESLSKDDSKKLLLIFAPFAPFVTEEIWNMFGEKGSIHSQKWPEFNQQLIIDDSVTIPVQVNGKVRDTMIIKNYELRITNYVTTEAKKSEKVKKYLEGKMIKKTIYVPGKLVNFVVD